MSRATLVFAALLLCGASTPARAQLKGVRFEIKAVSVV